MPSPFASSALPAWLHASTELQELLLAAHAAPLSLSDGEDIVGEQAHSLYLRLVDHHMAEPLRLSADLVLSATGHAMAETITRAWTSGSIRAEFAELCVLQAAAQAKGRLTLPDAVAASAPQPLTGPALTAGELTDTIDLLGQQDLILTVGTWGAPAVHGITGAGARRLARGLVGDSTESASQVDQRSYTNTITVEGDNHGNLAIGEQVTQTTTVHTQAVQYLDEAIEATADLPEELAILVQPALKAARTDLATTDQDPSKARKLLTQAKQLLVWAGNEDGPVANLLRIIGMVMALIVPRP